jgi:RNA polymerase sigma-70 factor (sigma-E family)
VLTPLAQAVCQLAPEAQPSLHGASGSHGPAVRAANLKTAGNKTPACSLLVGMDPLSSGEFGAERIWQSPPAAPLTRQSREAEFTEYVQARLPWLRRIAYRLTQDWQLADDLTQVTITSLYMHWSRARDASSTDAYARTILVRAFIAERRSPWTRRVQLDGSHAEHAAAAADHDACLDVRAALAALPPRQRATVVLRYCYGLPIDQTASELGCSEGTVKSQTAKALAALRRALAPLEAWKV